MKKNYKTLGDVLYAQFGVYEICKLNESEVEKFINIETIKMCDCFYEPMLQHLIYTYHYIIQKLNISGNLKCAYEYEPSIEICNHEQLSKELNIVVKAINYIFDKYGDVYDFNAINLNEQTALMVASERDCTAWIVEKLLKIDNIDLYVRDDENHNVFEVIDKLSTRKDLFNELKMVKIIFYQHFFGDKLPMRNRGESQRHWVDNMWSKIKNIKG